MKRAIATLVVALTALVTACGTGMEEPQPLPHHQNPATVSGGVGPAALFSLFGNLLVLMNDRRYEDTSSLGSLVPSISVPQELRLAVNRYTELLSNVNSNLATADRELQGAASFMQRGEGEQAQPHLAAAGLALGQASRDAQVLETVTDSLARRVGAAAAPPGDPLAEAYRRLRTLVQELRGLVWIYQITLTRVEAKDIPAVPRAQISVTVVLEAPGQGHPGRDLPIAGSATVADGSALGQGRWQVLLGDSVLEAFTGPTSFQTFVTLPAETLEGRHTLSLKFTAQESGAEGEVRHELHVLKLRPNLTFAAPDIALLKGSVQVSGRAFSAFGPVQRAQVIARIEGRTAAAFTDADGAFSLRVDLPPFARALGPQTVRVSVRPVEPWYAASEMQGRVFVLNFFGVGLGTVAVAYLTAGFWTWSRRRRPGAHFPLPGVAEAAEAQPPVAPGHLRTPELPLAAMSSPRGRILAAYFAAAQGQASRYATPFLPQFTLRDFLRRVGARIGSAFAELTGLAERALYRPREPAEAEARRAEELAGQVNGGD